jgi:hypothetical protein
LLERQNVAGIVDQSKSEQADQRKFKLDFVRKIGALDETDENYQFFMAFDASMDEEGNIYVMDSGNYRIQIFDPAGKYLKTIGREGNGPGEFRNLFSMDLDGNGNLYVTDRNKRSLEQFGHEGTFIKSKRFQSDYSYIRITGPESFCAPIIDVIVPGYRGLMVKASYGWGNNDELKCISSVSLVDETTKEFCAGLPEEEGLFSGSQINANVFETDRNHNLFVSFKHQNRIEKYAPDGRHLLTIDRPLNFPIEYKTVERIWKSGNIGEKFPEFGGTYASVRLGQEEIGEVFSCHILEWFQYLL